MIFDEESASDAQKFLAPPKRRILETKSTPKFLKQKSPNKNWGCRKIKSQKCLKRVFPKFHADWSHVRGVNGHSKFEKKRFRRRKFQNKMKMKLPPNPKILSKKTQPLLFLAPHTGHSVLIEK